MMGISTNKRAIMGMIIDDASAMMISAIILLPIARSIGFDPYHFAAIASINVGLDMITPPAASLLYLSEVVVETPANTYLKPTFYYVIFGYFPTLALPIFFPVLSTWLPHMF